MDQQQAGRFVVQIEEEAPRGGLFQLELSTYYRVVDSHTKEVIMTFQGQIEASLSAEDGMWEDYSGSGVREVVIAPDEQAAIVRYYDGREEMAVLPSAA